MGGKSPRHLLEGLEALLGMEQVKGCKLLEAWTSGIVGLGGVWGLDEFTV